MKSVSGKTLCKIIERKGWELKRVTGSHHIYIKQGVDAILSILVHGNRDLPIRTLKSIMKVVLNLSLSLDSLTPVCCDRSHDIFELRSLGIV